MKTRSFAAFLVVCAICLSIPAPVPAAIDATAKIKVLLQRSTFAAGSATTTNTYFLKNTSTSTMTGPFRVVLESLDNRDVAVLNPDGYTRDGKPYFEYAKASLTPSAKTAGKPWMLYQRCGKKVSATVKPFDAAWQIDPPAACSPLATLHVSVLASEGGANHTPVAEAGPDQTVKAGTLVTLDGSHSTDEDGNALTYRWSVVSKPAGGKVTLKGATSVRPTVKFPGGDLRARAHREGRGADQRPGHLHAHDGQLPSGGRRRAGSNRAAGHGPARRQPLDGRGR